MLLILTNSQDVTADYLASVLNRHGVVFLRLDTDTALQQIGFDYECGRPVVQFDGAWHSPERFSNVWYRRPERLRCSGTDNSPEGKFVLEEWAEALEGFLAHIEEAKWVNHPSRNVRASHKLEQLSRARSLGLMVPDTLVTQAPDRLRDFHTRHGGRVIAKPMASGYVERPEGERDSLIYTNRVQAEHLADLDDLKACPTLFQQFVEKQCDVRITVVDGNLHAVELTAREPDGSQRCDIRRNNMDDVAYRPTTLPDDVRSQVEALVASYGLRFAAIDMAVTPDGKWVFFEVNPNGQWAWLDMCGATDIAMSFVTAFSTR
ncbi:MAG TPA: ATP-grasp domain-containing protein [Gemmata sp.]|jgi:glutathione synthase/RimK-type ligase-like ATP-grasp enzyme|nr:ATP-grasp domain-containing protein [Gemmata sp.]